MVVLQFFNSIWTLAVATHLYLRARLLAPLRVVPGRVAATVRGHATRTVDIVVAILAVKGAMVYTLNSVRTRLRTVLVNFTTVHQEVTVWTRRTRVVAGQSFLVLFRGQGLQR